MFAVSYKWLLEILKKDLVFEEILNALDVLGFEVKSVKSVGIDYVINIEVKANRPDMLSHFGVAREIASFFNIKLSEPVFELEEKIEETCPFEIKVNTDLCKSYNALFIDGIENGAETPEYIKNRLNLFGMESVNPIVDISNYVTLEYGQPTHIYDRDKFSENYLEVSDKTSTENFYDLSNRSLKLQNGDIVIKNGKKVVCLAGIVGSSVAETDKFTKNIVIESAFFDKIPIRMTAKRLKISTLASFRFERGVDRGNSRNILNLIANMIVDLCGGRIVGCFLHNSCVGREKYLNIRISRTNKILGTSLNEMQISKALEKYNFDCNRKDEDNILVKIPGFRLDIEREIDLIEEVARSIGYDSIEPKKLSTDLVYRCNDLYERFDVLRNIFTGFGFNEVINYSFIPSEICNIIDDLDKNKCIILQNPISNMYDLMRPNLLYSLIYSLSYNRSIGNYNGSFFEIGRIYELDNTCETFSNETDCFGFVISGNKIDSGFGVVKPVKYDFYDLTSYLNSVFDFFNHKNVKFLPKKVSYMNSCYELICNNEVFGFIGEVEKSKFIKVLPNLKLVRDKVFYCELRINKLENSKKTLKFESKFPAILRQYNLICPKRLFSYEILNCIKSFGDLINKVTIRDVYEDSNMRGDEHSLLFEVEYRSSIKTITIEAVEDIEKALLEHLFNKFGIKIK